jgi:hypothetical protein
VARTTISTWLEPAKIDTDIRKYVDESLPIKNSAITKLHRRWTALINKMSREVVLQKLSDSFLTGKHEVKDIIDFINHIEGIQKDNRNFTVSSIKNSHGDLVATIKQKLNGGISINFEKHVEEGTIDALKATIEEKLSQL